jgi:hypothetical protein
MQWDFGMEIEQQAIVTLVGGTGQALSYYSHTCYHEMYIDAGPRTVHAVMDQNEQTAQTLTHWRKTIVNKTSTSHPALVCA